MKKPVHLIATVYLVLVLAATAQVVWLGMNQGKVKDRVTYKYNNYIIFQQSFHHLMEGKDLYKTYPHVYADLFKYSPTFALLFGIFAFIPPAAGLFFWNLLNAFLLLYAILLLPKPELKWKIGMLWFMLPELMTSIQNSQSNALIAGMIILSFALLERDRYFLACMSLILAVFIKPFAVAGIVLFLLYRGKGRLAGYTAFWFLCFLLLPLIIIDLPSLGFHYRKWMDLLGTDYSNYYGISVMGLLYSWFGVGVNKAIVILASWGLFMIPLVRIKRYTDPAFRLAILSSLLLWVVIFNHKAESPTFIIAISGVAIWFLSRPITRVNTVLAVLAMVFTSLSVTDLFPVSIRDGFFVPYCIKALPCLLIWFKILYDLTFSNESIRQ